MWIVASGRDGLQLPRDGEKLLGKGESMSDHFLLGLLIFGQTIVLAISLTVTYIFLGREVRYVAQIAERILNRVEEK